MAGLTMGVHRKRKGVTGKYAAKNTFKVQDPFSNRKEEVDPQRNAPPKKSDDDLFFPAFTKGIYTPLLEESAPLDYDRPDTPMSKRQARIEKLKEKKKAKQQEAKGSTDLDPDGEDELKKPDTGLPKGTVARHRLPKQKPGEPLKAYKLRLDKAVMERLKETNKVVTSERVAEKRRLRREELKKVKDEIEKDDELDRQDGLYKKEKPIFGDYVERPPILSALAMKSRSKLKSLWENPPLEAISEVGLGLVNLPTPAVAADDGNNRLKVKDLNEYASKVREAYTTMKKRRLGEAGADMKAKLK